MNRPLNPSQEASLFVRLRARIVWTSLQQLIATARLRVTLASVMSTLFWIGMFLLMYEGFMFLEHEAGAFSHATVEKVFNLFYASLMVMLLFSSAIILYGAIYRSPEVAFLLTTPTSASRVFSYKFQEAILFSSWGFLLLGSPMLVAYGIVVGAPWYYFLMILPFMVAFVYIPTGIGAILCLLIVQNFTKVFKPLAVLAALAIVVAAGWAAWKVFFGGQHDMLTTEWFEGVMRQLSATENRMFPSWWLSSGLLEAARSDGGSLDYQPWAQGVLFLSLLVANALFFHQLAVWTAGAIYRSSYSRLHTERGSQKRAPVWWIDEIAPNLMPFMTPQVRLLMVKDFRLFRRDPVQWTQFLIFFGLVGLYFMNVRSIRYGNPFIGWVNVVSFLNLTVVGLILSTFTTRFVFPMISLEGRRFWILGLLPVRRETILWGKFFFAAVGSAIPCCLLILVSDIMLGISSKVILVHQLTCLVLCSGLAGIAVGLGARMPDLRETSPSKIAAGFGGTLNLVLSAFYILLVVGLTAAPCHLYVLAQDGQLQRQMDLSLIRWALFGGIAGSLVLGLIATLVPLRIGFRAFRDMEF